MSTTEGSTMLAKDEPNEGVGQMLGRYKLLEKVGEGGCGVVYVAEQTEPVRRRVALKVIKLGMDTKAVVARFEAGRQALAMMDHPNIAKIFDAGVTGAPLPRRERAPSPSIAADEGALLVTRHSSLTTYCGRPYFVMELVRGIKITDYCDQSNLTTKERLELFKALAQPSDSAGRAQTRDSLDQAARLLRDLPEEAQQLHDSKELLSWIGAARKQTN